MCLKKPLLSTADAISLEEISGETTYATNVAKKCNSLDHHHPQVSQAFDSPSRLSFQED